MGVILTRRNCWRMVMLAVLLMWHGGPTPVEGLKCWVCQQPNGRCGPDKGPTSTDCASGETSCYAEVVIEGGKSVFSNRCDSINAASDKCGNDPSAPSQKIYCRCEKDHCNKDVSCLSECPSNRLTTPTPKSASSQMTASILLLIPAVVITASSMPKLV